MREAKQTTALTVVPNETPSLMSAKDVRKNIKRIIATAGKLQAMIHETAVLCLAHAQIHGDVTLMDDLYRGLPQGQRTESLKAWVETYSPLRFKSGDKGAGLLKKDDKGYVEFDLEAAAATPYFAERERVAKPLTLAQLQKLIEEQLEQRVKNAEAKGTLGEGEDLDTLQAYVAQVKAASQAFKAPTTITVH